MIICAALLAMLATPAPRVQSPQAPPLREETFTMKTAGEAVGTITASCRDCDWGAKGREAAIVPPGELRIR